MDPWNIQVVTPSAGLILKFESWDNIRSFAPKRRSFNRARKWISDLLKRPFKIPENEKLRHYDTAKALDDMINALAIPGGKTYEEYLISCLAPMPIQDQVQNSPLRYHVATNLNICCTLFCDGFLRFQGERPKPFDPF